MNLYNLGYEIEMEGDKISHLEEKMLESGLCNFTIPMWISRENGKIKARYECSGLVSVRELQLKKPRETFEIIEKALLALNRSVDFYISPEKVKLTLDTVYYSKTNRSVKIAYIPQNGHSLSSNIKSFIEEIGKDTLPETKEYLGILRKDVCKENRNLREIAGFVSEYRKSIGQCQKDGERHHISQ